MALLFVDSLPKPKSKFLHTSIKILEVFLLLLGLVSTLAIIKGTAVVPYSCEIVFSSLLGFWNSFKCFLSSSLYICLFLNFTVMLIAISSTFHHRETDNQDHQINNLNTSTGREIILVDSPPPSAPPLPPPPSPPPPPPPSVVALICNETPISESHHEIKTREIVLLPESIKEKNIATTSEEDSMDATWKAITGGGKKQRTNTTIKKKGLIKKSETWEVIPPRRRSNDNNNRVLHRVDSEELVGPASPKWTELRKSETFDGAVGMRLRGGRIRRDPSMSIEEFNEQVEAFIKKFNDNIRLQRQESEMRFLDNIQRGV
ncbi:hypothetical protein ABFS82_09G003600 [Erythranthe guttata]|uniref:DUF4408 domain-containing protein n=1 Tax=Erythranthe guttata TaxID=4155 RepID=A0A022RUX2_ERYGU|nr:hypothetical protein MIMGU_mgv1a010305mg [Erythranthe guttata]